MRWPAQEKTIWSYIWSLLKGKYVQGANKSASLRLQALHACAFFNSFRSVLRHGRIPAYLSGSFRWRRASLDTMQKAEEGDRNQKQPKRNNFSTSGHFVLICWWLMTRHFRKVFACFKSREACSTQLAWASVKKTARLAFWISWLNAPRLPWSHSLRSQYWRFPCRSLGQPLTAALIICHVC